MKTKRVISGSPVIKSFPFTNRSAIQKRIKSCQQMILAVSIGLGMVNNALGADNTQPSQAEEETKPVEKPNDGKGKLPFFYQADVNKDHFVTKDELINYPYLLQVFDKVDAGNDGKLEQHEYQNLKMEMKREGEVK
jgi:hypothetical protein